MSDDTARAPRVAYRVRTPRLLMRCWEPADAEALLASIGESLDHLRPWMPWAHHEPMALDAKIDQLRLFRADFDLDKQYIYALFPADGGPAVLGGAGLHRRAAEGVLEIGYWVNAAHQGRGLVSEATAALTRVAVELLGAHRVEIRCDPANHRSAAVPARLGYTAEGVLRQNVQADGWRDTQVWALLAHELPSSPSASVPIEAVDAAGRKLL